MKQSVIQFDQLYSHFTLWNDRSNKINAQRWSAVFFFIYSIHFCVRVKIWFFFIFREICRQYSNWKYFNLILIPYKFYFPQITPRYQVHTMIYSRKDIKSMKFSHVFLLLLNLHREVSGSWIYLGSHDNCDAEHCAHECWGQTFISRLLWLMWGNKFRNTFTDIKWQNFTTLSSELRLNLWNTYCLAGQDPNQEEEPSWPISARSSCFLLFWQTTLFWHTFCSFIIWRLIEIPKP